MSDFGTLYRDYSRGSVHRGMEKLGIEDDGYVSRVLLYISFGLLDAMWQTTSYWLIGAMSNSPQRLAHFTGFCESLSLARFVVGKTRRQIIDCAAMVSR
jgi:hypothetical protein